MANKANAKRKTAFEEGFKAVIGKLEEEIRQLYLSDHIPWVIGYSGGKDSTAVLQLIWIAISELPEEQRTKPIHVISTDTLVENPVVALWVTKSLKQMRTAAKEQGFTTIEPHRLTPEVKDRYWVNLIGKGYPAPRPKFRWCTSRLKINPSNNFIKNVVKQNGEAILVLGTRKAESTVRAANMSKYEATSTRELLSTHGQLDRSWVYTPISTWTNDDVWIYLNQVKNPWGYRNENLLGMYQGATEGGECPLVIDADTPSCGDSRFGCFVCTLVDKDKSMAAMVQNDAEKEWMLPLMEYRNNFLDTKSDRQHRDFRKMHGGLQFFNDRLVHGPYRKDYREKLLRELLKAQIAIDELKPKEIEDFELITFEELEEIRRIWVAEKHEFEDSLPIIYKQVTGKKYPGKPLQERQQLSRDDLKLLGETCKDAGDEEGVLFQALQEMLSIEQKYKTMARRSGLYGELNKSLEKSAFLTEQEAEDFAMQRSHALLEVVITEG